MCVCVMFIFGYVERLSSTPSSNSEGALMSANSS